MRPQQRCWNRSACQSPANAAAVDVYALPAAGTWRHWACAPWCNPSSMSGHPHMRCRPARTLPCLQVRPVLILAGLYVAALTLIVLIFSRLPNLEQLAGGQQSVAVCMATSRGLAAAGAATGGQSCLHCLTQQGWARTFVCQGFRPCVRPSRHHSLPPVHRAARAWVRHRRQRGAAAPVAGGAPLL